WFRNALGLSRGRAKLLLSRRPLTSKRGSPGGSPPPLTAPRADHAGVRGGSPYRLPATRSYHAVVGRSSGCAAPHGPLNAARRGGSPYRSPAPRSYHTVEP